LPRPSPRRRADPPLRVVQLGHQARRGRAAGGASRWSRTSPRGSRPWRR
jgi:hypothetical protein